MKGNTLDYVITFMIIFQFHLISSFLSHISNSCSYRRNDSIDTNIFVSDFNDLVFPGIDITQ